MQSRSLEQRLAPHCAPTLLGAKAASLLSLPLEDFPDLPLQLRSYNQTLYQTGVRFLILREDSKRFLVLVYRPTMLRKNLSAPEAKAVLASFAYPNSDQLGTLLRHLKSRFSQEDFPHEIGLFLDYPVDDVSAFIANRGAECKYCGYWKVYGDVDKAKELFACYDACRLCVNQMLAAGCTISQLLHAA